MKVDLVSRFGSQVVGVSAAGIETICDFPSCTRRGKLTHIHGASLDS